LKVAFFLLWMYVASRILLTRAYMHKHKGLVYFIAEHSLVFASRSSDLLITGAYMHKHKGFDYFIAEHSLV
jgi:hypothetical protein